MVKGQSTWSAARMTEEMGISFLKNDHLATGEEPPINASQLTKKNPSV